MFYSFYGLTLGSSIAIPALPAACEAGATRTPDVSFEIGRPAWVVEALARDSENIPTGRSREGQDHSKFTLKAHGAGDFFQLVYSDGTRFLVDHSAKRVWGEPGPGLSQDDVFVYLLGPIAGFILRRRGRMALHASAVRIGEQGIALMGPAGAGKSTTAAALALRNWPVCCEDVCALRENAGKIDIVPGYPRICLWPDSVRYLFSSDDALPLIVAGWEKRYMTLDGQRCSFAEKPTALAAIYLLAPRTDEHASARIQVLSPREASLFLVQNTYMNWLLDRPQRAAEFDAIVKLVSRVKCFEVTPYADPARLEETAVLIESHALSLKR